MFDPTDPKSWYPTKAEMALAPYSEWNKQIRACHKNGYSVRIKKPHATAKDGFVLKYIRVTSITWRGHVDNPILCFRTVEGGFVDMCHYTFL